MSKKRIIFVYTKMIIGGSTTSLLSILNNIDYTLYEVDLALFDRGGELFDNIPSDVNVYILLNRFTRIRKFSPIYLFHYINARFMAKKNNNSLIISQIISPYLIKYYNKIKKNYDIAISFLEFLPNSYVSSVIRSNYKISWIHVNYEESRLLPIVDNKIFNNYNSIINVSKNCMLSFKKLYPEQSSKLTIIENILNKKIVNIKADIIENKPFLSCVFQKMSQSKNIKLISISRIDFNHKGHDRFLKAIEILYTKYNFNVDWYVVGDGPDYNTLKELVNKSIVNHNIILVGKLSNPFVLLKRADILVQPSYYEGKPMVVTESLLLGIPVMVTKYSSATEQIKNGYDGIIVENNLDSIVKGLYDIVTNSNTIDILKSNCNKEDYSNSYELDKVMRLLKGDLLNEKCI